MLFKTNNNLKLLHFRNWNKRNVWLKVKCSRILPMNMRFIMIIFSFSSTGPSNPYIGRFLGFSLYISNTTNKYDGTLCYKDTNSTNSTIPAIFNRTCYLHGQYIIYYNERLTNITYPDGYSKYAFNELCEVEAFGEFIYMGGGYR